jgi:hypothetical protein
MLLPLEGRHGNFIGLLSLSRLAVEMKTAWVSSARVSIHEMDFYWKWSDETRNDGFLVCMSAIRL